MTIFKKILTTALMLICLAVTAFAVIEHLTDYYDKGMEFTVNDTLPNGEGKKARVILLAGQSNACGCSRDEYLKQNVSEEKYAEYQNGYDNVYINYSVTNYEQSGEFVKCGANQGEPGGYFGPELGMAEKLNELYPDETFFIVKFAWGGSNLHEQWRSQSSFGKSGELYRNFISFVHTSMDYLISKNYDVNTIDRCSENGKCEAGTPFAIKVNDTDVYKFYVISDDGNAVTLIMNQNLYEEGNINPNIEWINEADYATENNKDEVPDTCSYTSCNDEGPITALNALDARTANWDYITAKDYTYSGLGADGTTKKYTNITRKMRVRMITSLEVNALKTNNNGTMPTWLYENLYSTGDTNTYGYWTSTARSSTSYHAGHVNTDGYLYSNTVSASGNESIRTVKEIFI